MMSKYHNIRSGGYDSKLETDYGRKLDLLVKTGDVIEYLHHPPSVKLCNGTITWAIDYWVRLINGEEVYVEVKGVPTREFRLKWKLYKWLRGYWDSDLLPVIIVQQGGKIYDSVGADLILRLKIL